MSLDNVSHIAVTRSSEEEAFLISKFAATSDPYDLITATVESLAEQAIVQGEIVGELFATTLGPGRFGNVSAISGSTPPAPAGGTDAGVQVTYATGPTATGGGGSSGGGGY